MRRVLAGLCLAAIAACAAAPEAEPVAAVPSSDCAALAADLRKIEQARQAALKRRKGAWKAVVPVAVAAIYVAADSDAAEAEQRRDALLAEERERGCAARA